MQIKSNPLAKGTKNSLTILRGSIFNSVLAPALCACFVLALLLTVVCPTAKHASADEGTPTAQSGTSSLGVSLTPAPTMEVQPNTSGLTTATATSQLNITTTDIEKFSVYVSTTNGSNTLVGKYPGNAQVINPVASTSQLSAFSANTWGYSLATSAPTSTTLFSAVPTTNTNPVLADVIPSGNDNFYLSIGTAIDLSLPTDTYKNEITVSVIATPFIGFDDFNLIYMQDMTSSIRDELSVGATTQLIDSRDNKKYWVAKLADGNCWMTQNLALDLSTSVTLTSADTNLPNGVTFTPGYNTEKDTTSSTSNYAETRSWSYHDGMLVLNSPNSGKYDGSTSDTMPMSYVTDVSNMSPTYVATGTGTALDPIDEENNAYDAHYLLGNYYMFNAATAGTWAATDGNENAPGSICPKGWRLPTSTSSGEFQALMTTYGMTDSTINALSERPLYFVRGGSVNTGDIVNVGNNGYYWSSTSTSETAAYYLRFSSGHLRPSNYHNQYYGRSVRCLVH